MATGVYMCTCYALHSSRSTAEQGRSHNKRDVPRKLKFRKRHFRRAERGHRGDRCRRHCLPERVLHDFHALGWFVDGAFVLDRVNSGTPVAVLRTVRLVDLCLQRSGEVVAAVKLCAISKKR